MSERPNAAMVVSAGPHPWCELGTGVLILNRHSGCYYELDSSAASVWRLIQGPRQVDEVVRALSAMHGVAPDRCESELEALLADLVTKGLVEVNGG